MAFFVPKILQRFLFGLLPKAISVFTFLIIFPSLLFSNCIVSCVQSFNLSLGVEGSYQVTPADLLVDIDCNPLDFHVIVYDEYGQPKGDVIDCQLVGQTVSAIVYETATGNSCTTTIQVYDNLPPTINCLDTTLLCGLNYDPATLGFPEIFDNCTELDSTDLSYSDQVTNYDCLEIINGDTINAIIQRTWSTADQQGNPKTCIQEIKFKKSTVWDAQFPPDRNDLMLPSLDCNEDPFDISLTGEPSIQGIPVSQGTFCDLIVSHDDTQVPHCGANSFVIIREWTVVDWCTGAFRNHNQIIKVADQTAPEITCPADLTVYSNVYDCFGVVNLWPASATDDCSEVTITASWQFGTGLGPFLNIPLGTYPVTYTAEDACGNISTCQIQVTMMDNAPPISICNSSAQYNLGLDGTAIVFPTVFDDGTYDNCGISHFQIAYAGGIFSDSLILSCDDLLNNPVDLEVRSWDVHGNYNDCDVQVLLSDKLNPVVNCPADVTLNCSVDYLDLTITGSPLVFDNCTVDTVYFSDQENLNSCNVGEVIRTWTVLDGEGHMATCNQSIYLEDADTLIVQFPANIYLTDCGVELDTALTGSPIFQNKNCELLSVSFTDDTLGQALPACYIVTRHWQVYDWCNYDPVTNEGYWSSHQILTVADIEDPILSIPNDTIVYHSSETCGAFYFEFPIATATDCSGQVSIINNSIYADQNGANATGMYPPGIHTIQYYAEDGCGNSTASSFQITVLDGKEPTAVCGAGLQFELGLNGEVVVTVDDINEGSFDNCTATENLQFSVSPSLFTCNELGANIVELTVQDEAGLISTCTTTIYIQDNQGACPGGTVKGSINNWQGSGVNNAKVEFTGALQDTLYTDLAGEFTQGQLTVGQNVLLKPFKSGNFRNGLSTLDVVLLSRHIVGLEPLTNPYQILAGDVDRDGAITPFDMIRIQRLILFMDNEFENSNSWRFASSEHIFNNPADPFLNEPQELMAINNIPDADINVDFVGMKMGDINGNSNPGLAMHNSLDLNPQRPMNINLLELEGNIRMIIDTEFSQEFYGMQLSLPMKLSEESAVDLLTASGELTYHYEEDKEMLHVLINSPEAIVADAGFSLIEISRAQLLNEKFDCSTLQGLFVDDQMQERMINVIISEISELAAANEFINRKID